MCGGGERKRSNPSTARKSEQRGGGGGERSDNLRRLIHIRNHLPVAEEEKESIWRLHSESLDSRASARESEEDGGVLADWPRRRGNARSGV